jgi:HlyD family secretion protein
MRPVRHEELPAIEPSRAGMTMPTVSSAPLPSAPLPSQRMLDRFDHRPRPAAQVAAVPLASAVRVKHSVLFGAIVSLALCLGIGSLVVFTQITGAVVTQGFLVVESNVKTVQHQQGGIVSELLVKEGDRVELGQLLVRLDPTAAQASLAVYTDALNQGLIRQVRLEAELTGRDTVAFPDKLPTGATGKALEPIVGAEQRIFEARRASRLGEQAQLRERVGQLKLQIQGLEIQAAAKLKEIGFIKQELEGVRALWTKRLVPLQRVNQVERDATRLEGERGTFISNIAQVNAQITETELAIISVTNKFNSDVSAELKEVQAKNGELLERRLAALDVMNRTEIRAPQAGIVNGLKFHTVGGVIAPADTVMLIVPERDKLLAEVRLSPADIDKVHVGQDAIIRFSAFDRNTTPTAPGTLQFVSPDITVDQRTGAGYFVARLGFDEAQFNAATGAKLQPGMPIEGYIVSADRSIISLLLKPLTDQMFKAFRN